MDKINLVYFSAAGTTKTVATVLAESLQREIIAYDLLRRLPEHSITFDPDVPIIFAMPVYAGRIPALCVNMLKQFQGKKTPAIAVVVYGNRDYDDALLELKDIVSENGFVVIAAAAVVAQHSVFPTVASGRPDQKDKQKIASFGQKCNLTLREFTGTEEITVKGNTPYREAGTVPLQPSGNAKCNACGACVKLCPTKAITAENPRKTDKTRCIACTACISACPQNARAFHGPLYAVASKGFTRKNSIRKEPAFFIYG